MNGGLTNYESFIDGTYQKDNPEIANDVNSSVEKQQVIQQLIFALYDQLQLLEDGMKLHQRKCLVDMIPLHEHLYGRYQQMKENLIRLLKQQQD